MNRIRVTTYWDWTFKIIFAGRKSYVTQTPLTPFELYEAISLVVNDCPGVVGFKIELLEENPRNSWWKRAIGWHDIAPQ